MSQNLTVAVMDDPCWPEHIAPLWIDTLERHGVRVRLVDLLRDDGLETLHGCDGLMWHIGNRPTDRMYGETILRVVNEVMGIPTFPPLSSLWHFDNKVRQAYLARHLGIPYPRTWVFWRYDDALKWLESATLPVVVKSATGECSRNVVLLRDHRECRRVIETAFREGIWHRELEDVARGRAVKQILREARRFGRRVLNLLRLKPPPNLKAHLFAERGPQDRYVLFQEFCPNNSYDTRVIVIGDKVFAIRRLNRPDDFRASGSGLLQDDPALIDHRFVELARESCRKLRAEVMAFDGLYDNDRRPVFGEFGYSFPYLMAKYWNKHWRADGTIVTEKCRPETCVVEVFLEEVRRCGAECRRAAGVRSTVR